MSRTQSIPYTIPFVYRYDTCPRFDRRYADTLFNLITGKSLYSFRNTSSHYLKPDRLPAEMILVPEEDIYLDLADW